MASNRTTVIDDLGNYSDWVEIWNSSTEPINLNGIYLSDDPTIPDKWQVTSDVLVSPRGFFVFWPDDRDTLNHTNFKLDKDYDFIGIYSSTGSLIDSISFRDQKTDVSFGRNVTEINNWGYFTTPTPNANNNNQQISGLCSPVFYSIDGGFYQSGIELSLSVNSENDRIYYTVDGSIPNPSSFLYTGPITINETTVFRAYAFNSDKIPSEIVTQTYFIDEEFTLPVISLSTDPKNFFDDEIGIYVIGTNGVSGYCANQPMNVNQDWERPVNIELYDENKKLQLNQQAGVKIFGGCSRTRYPQKSLALYARREYGKGSFDYKLFKDRENDKFESFILRTSSDDANKTMFRDALSYISVKDVVDIDGQSYQPSIVFINGEYWGIHNIREKINEHYVANNYGMDASEVNLVKRDPSQSWNVISGSANHYNAMLNYITGHNMKDNAVYENVKTFMDVNQFINYQIIQIFMAGDDWPGNNIKFWRANSGKYNKWRWVMYDLDWTFLIPERNVIERATEPNGPSWPNPPWSTILFRKLLENDQFKNTFLSRYSYYLNTIFDSDRLIGIIDSLQAQIAPEIPRQIERWGGQLVPNPESWIPPAFNSMDEWNANVQVMRDFTVTRPPIAINNIVSFFNLGGSSKFKIETNLNHAGYLKFLDYNLYNEFEGNFFNNVPYSINAVPGEGYIFSHWEIEGLTTETNTLIPVNAAWSYHDLGQNLGTAWKENSYDDSSWKTGNAELGYGDGDENTVVSFGPNSQDKYVTTYFRKTFQIDNPQVVTQLSMELLYDDGAIVYLNGNEIVKTNMPDGEISYNTYASGWDISEDSFSSFIIAPEFLQTGENVIAVEIHQASGSSSDISFNLTLNSRSQGNGSSSQSFVNPLTINLSGDTKLKAVFVEDSGNESEPIIINEINYNSSSVEDAGDWIEIYNRGESPFDLSDWIFKDSNFDNNFRFPEGSILGPNQYLVVSNDTTKFKLIYNDVKTLLGNFDFNLSNGGELIGLFDSDSTIIDSVRYDDQSPWPVGADGTGSTLELIDSEYDNTFPQNWKASANLGSPGRKNGSVTDIKSDPKKITEMNLQQNYPNPFNSITTINYSVPDISGNQNVSIKIYDILGNLITTLVDEPKSSGNYTLRFNTSSIGRSISSGIYFYRLNIGSQSVLKKMIYLK
ncbi:MAG: CotH kinase family protein [Melioribacteraceae bacterium]|nr:CotH kinase family protein [Melioribacteraceae bacterium]MCF8264150.1 CotH kinase family protein [Melioribacteraceae bacterium]MCF8432161.1 CotH kinase family protein [Melioribacteraceae bacterium]